MIGAGSDAIRRPTRSNGAGSPFPFFRPTSAADPVLFCFPYAGSGGAGYRRWARGLPPGLAVCPVEYPGRGARWREPLRMGVDEVAREVGAAIARLPTRTFSLYGHSLGALIAFEVARYLRRHGGPSPRHLLVSASGAPHVPNPNPLIHHLSDAELVAALVRYNGIPTLVLENRELLHHLLPVVRADLTAFETYRYVDEAPLDCPIFSYGGRVDPWVHPDRVEGWARQTTRRFRVRMFPGDHFFVNADNPAVLRALATDMLGSLGAAA